VLATENVTEAGAGVGAGEAIEAIDRWKKTCPICVQNIKFQEANANSIVKG